MDESLPVLHSRAAAAVIELLNGERLMTVAVNRPDGWPQATTVGYYNEGLDLYFSISRESQKFINLQSDSRASIALRSPSGGGSVGLSMAGHVTEISDRAEAEGLDQRLMARYPDAHVYAPSGEAIALMRFRPIIVSAVGVVHDRSDPETFRVAEPEPEARPMKDESRLF
jgi:general stress protein 26